MTSRTPRYRWLFGAFALVVATAFITTQVVSQDKGQGQPSDAEKQKMMEEFAKFAEPGPQHKQLASMAGRWKATSRFQMDPSQKADEGTGSAHMKTILGGRWILNEYEGSSSMGPFSGLGLTGYDIQKKKYVSIWMDTMCTGAMISEGTADSTGKIITYTGKYDDPMTGQPMSAGEVATLFANPPTPDVAAQLERLRERYIHGSTVRLVVHSTADPSQQDGLNLTRTLREALPDVRLVLVGPREHQDPIPADVAVKPTRSVPKRTSRSCSMASMRAGCRRCRAR